MSHVRHEYFHTHLVTNLSCWLGDHMSSLRSPIRFSVPAAACRFKPPTRFPKNSSRLRAVIARKRRRCSGKMGEHEAQRKTSTEKSVSYAPSSSVFQITQLLVSDLLRIHCPNSDYSETQPGRLDCLRDERGPRESGCSNVPVIIWMIGKTRKGYSLSIVSTTVLVNEL